MAKTRKHPAAKKAPAKKKKAPGPAKEGDLRIKNEFWKMRSKHGRDKLFASPALLWEAACEYFQWATDNPLYETDFKGGFATRCEIPRMRAFTMQGLTLYLGVNTAYFHDFEKGLDTNAKEPEKAALDKDFSEVVTRIRDTIFQQKFEGAAAGQLNANIIARETGLADKKDVAAAVSIALPPITGMEVI